MTIMASMFLTCAFVILMGLGAVDGQWGTDIPPLIIPQETESPGNSPSIPKSIPNTEILFPVLTPAGATGFPPLILPKETESPGNPQTPMPKSVPRKVTGIPLLYTQPNYNKLNLVFSGRCDVCNPQSNRLNRKQLLAKVKNAAYAFVISKFGSKQGKTGKRGANIPSAKDSFRLKGVFKTSSALPELKVNSEVILSTNCDCYSKMRKRVLYVAIGKEVVNGRVVLDKESPLIILRNRRDIAHIKRHLKQSAKKGKPCKGGKKGKKCKRGGRKLKPNRRPKHSARPTADPSSDLSTTPFIILWR